MKAIFERLLGKKNRTVHGEKPVLCVDFDGVLYSYETGWHGVAKMPDGPVPGTREAIEALQKSFSIKVYSTRCRSWVARAAMKRWLQNHQIPFDEVCRFKPDAMIYLDDKAIQFHGSWKDALEKIRSFSHWLSAKNKKDV